MLCQFSRRKERRRQRLRLLSTRCLVNLSEVCHGLPITEQVLTQGSCGQEAFEKDENTVHNTSQRDSGINYAATSAFIELLLL